MPVKPEDLAALKKVVSPTDGVEEILCAQSKAEGYLFACVRVRSGAYCAVWESHAHAYATLEEMLAAVEDLGLNRHERWLVEMAHVYGVRINAGEIRHAPPPGSEITLAPAARGREAATLGAMEVARG